MRPGLSRSPAHGSPTRARRSGTVRTSSLIYLTPPVTLVWAWAMFGQPMSLYTWAGLLLCLAGVALAREPRVANTVLSAEKA